MSSVEAWEELMAQTMTADYVPGAVMAPGPGDEGADPLGIHYADLGPLAFVLNEAMDSAVNRGVDRDQVLETIATTTGGGCTASDVESVLGDDLACPPLSLLQAFATCLSIDLDVIIDAAEKGGCKGYGPIPSTPPGY
jgi:hypothetical protein